MKHRLPRVLLASLCLLALLLKPALASDIRRTGQSLTVDGRSAECESYNIDGSNYFKLRDLAVLLSEGDSRFSVDYDPAADRVDIVTGASYTPVGGELSDGGDRSATARPSRQTICINGRENPSLTVYNIGDQNYFQLRELGRVLGFRVGYDEESRTVTVDSIPGGKPSVRLGETEDAGREYLDRLIFLGDSTTYGIGYYYRHGYPDLCPPAQVWTPKSGTMNLSDYAKARIVYPETKEELLITEAVERSRPDILVITLGVNGIGYMDRDWFLRDYTALVKSIQAASPDTGIILNSIYPVADSWQYQSSINNDKIREANLWIEELAELLGARYLSSFDALEVEGKLPENRQNGDGLHLTGEAFGLVMTYLRTHAWN